MPYYKTPVAARKLGIPYSHLISLLRSGKVHPPEKDTSGDYVWSERDLAAARSVLESPRSNARGVASAN
jgi:hypothetical protein